ncbi:SAM-dependent methyltransferase [Nonomuraea sp. NPDC046802]|uniref:SAM-dependent methyltransferase n=1 Tax=Nonomuraea sp. NPDC046802 TaxID=3154919 RepID=UPI00340DDB2D
MNQPPPRGVDPNIPSVARMYDYHLRGKENYPKDRAVADQVHQDNPNVRLGMRENRHFLRRAVTYLAGECNIRQFLDIGSGLPTSGNVHEIAQRLNPTARVIYIDNDASVLTHARALVDGDDKVRVVAGDMRRVQDILDDREVQHFINWNEPVGLILVALLHFISDKHDPYHLVTTLRDQLPPGSYMALSHGSADGFSRAQISPVEEHYEQATEQLALRSQESIVRFFDGFDLVPPGVVLVPTWRPDGISEGEDPRRCGTFGGVGRVRVA